MAVRLAKAEGAVKTEKGWWELPSGKLLVPEKLAHNLVSQTHQVTHLGMLPAHRLMLPLGFSGKNLRVFS